MNRSMISASIPSQMQENEAAMQNQMTILGLVREGQFRLSVPTGRDFTQARLTKILPEAGQPPETKEIDLTPYEGQAIMVRGFDLGAWIYAAEIIDTAGPILTAVVERLSGLPSAPAK
jgi:hypothetical protein